MRNRDQAPAGAGVRAALPPFAALLALSACVGADEPAPVVSEPVVQAIPPAPSPTPPPLPAPDFAYSGELTQGGWMRGTVPAGTVSARLDDQPLAFDPATRAFFAAFDRDSEATLTLSAMLENGRSYSEQVAVSPRAWDIERVNVPLRSGGTSEEWWAKREPEWNAIVEARAQQTGAQGWQQDFVWPVKGRISGRFGRQRIYQGEPGSYHSGIDIAPGNGVPYVAPADGVVVLAREGFSLEGGLIIIDHGAGLNSAFLHSSKIVVREGDRVRQGQHIGNVGATGRATGPHLHWSLKWNEARLDPLLLTGPMD